MKRDTINFYILLLVAIVSLCVSLYIAYLIQFKFGFFGANYITLNAILGLWVGFPLVFTGLITLIMSGVLTKR